MPIKKYKPLSPDPYVGKTKGDIELAKLAHLNNLVDQVNTELSVDPRPYKVYTAILNLRSGNPGINAIPILENTLQEIEWTKDNTGIYIGTALDFPFPYNNTFIYYNFINSTNIDGKKINVSLGTVGEQQQGNEIWSIIQIKISEVTSPYSLVDGDFKIAIEIRVYN